MFKLYYCLVFVERSRLSWSTKLLTQPVQVRFEIVRDWAEARGGIAPQGVEKTVHENASGPHAGGNERHHPEERLEVGQCDSLLKKGGLALRKQVREAIRGDAHRHIQCVKKNAEEDHRSGRRTVFVRGGLEAKVEQQAGGGGFGGNFSPPKSSM